MIAAFCCIITYAQMSPAVSAAGSISDFQRGRNPPLKP